MGEHIADKRERQDAYWYRYHVDAVAALNVARRGLLKAGRTTLPEVELVQPPIDNVHQLRLAEPERDSAA